MTDDQRSPAASATSTSRSLLALLRDDQPAAWQRLTSLYAPLVYHWCRRMGLGEQDMPDVFQQVFQSVAAHIGQFQKLRPGDTFRGWLRTITCNKVRDHFRRTSRQPRAAGGTDAQIYLSHLADPIDDALDSAVLNAAAEAEEVHELLHAALQLVRQQVHPRTWQAFWQVVVEGRSPEEAGAALAMRPGTVRVAKSRVLSRLRAELGELPGPTDS